MASFTSATATAALLLFSDVTLAGKVKSCPRSTGLSCHNTTTIQNTCCTNSPGGLLLQTQFWDYDPATGPDNAWTVHGLWPDNCDGTYEQYCDPNREYTNITEILQSYNKTGLLKFMNKYWKDYQGDDESFWEHEFNKHGTCISTLEPECYNNYSPQQEVVDYFQRTAFLYSRLNSYKFLKNAGIVPSTTKTYQLSAVQAALKKAHHNEATIQCDDAGSINEIWYYFNTRGPIRNGLFLTAPPTTKGDCPDTVNYFPKGYSAPQPTSTPGQQPTATSSTAGSPSATSTGPPFIGKGFLNVQVSGSQEGCLISAGTWYTTGTCATYTATPSESESGDDGFTLTSSKGNCAVNPDTMAFGCGSGVTDATVFGAEGNFLTFGGSQEFSAEETAAGQKQEVVKVGEGNVDLKVSWEGR